MGKYPVAQTQFKATTALAFCFTIGGGHVSFNAGIVVGVISG